MKSLTFHHAKTLARHLTMIKIVMVMMTMITRVMMTMIIMVITMIIQYDIPSRRDTCEPLMGKPQKTKTRGGEAIKVERTKVLSSLSQRSTFVQFSNFKMNEGVNWLKSNKG